MKMDLNGKEVAGLADGIRCDKDGNIWAGMGWVGEGYDGVHIFSPEGKRIGQILLPEICSQRLLRRPAPQPPLHGGQPQPLRRPRRGHRRALVLTRAYKSPPAFPPALRCQ